MKTRYLALCMCMAVLIVTCNTFGQDQAQGQVREKREGQGGLMRGEKGGLTREGGERRLMGREGADMQGGPEGMQEMVLARIVNDPKMASEMGFSEEQIKTLKSSQEEMKKKHEDLEKQLKEAGLEQAKIMMEDSGDENAIIAAVEKAGNIRTEMAKARIRHMMLVKKTLKPEQVAKIKERVQARIKQMRAEKGAGDSPVKDRIHERRKKFQEENKDGPKTDGKKTEPEKAAQGV